MKPFYLSNYVEAGVDEAGRGCLAGPVVAAAVILPTNYYNKHINDSKLLSATQRERLRKEIELHAISYSVAFVNPEEIDTLNILNASMLAMHRALEKLTILPDLILVDGNRFVPFRNIEYRCIVKGDTTYQSIAAASILAKTYRDDFMMSAHKQYPYYEWHKNKGYPTKRHRNAIIEHGISPHHRKSFRLFSSSSSLPFF